MKNMCSQKSYTRKHDKKEVLDKYVQTDITIYLTEVEQTMLYFIRVFKITIASLTTLCCGVVYNYSSRRYSVATEPIETDSEEEEPRSMDPVDDSINKLVEESNKNKELLNNVMSKSDLNIFQLIQNKNTATTANEVAKRFESIGINTDMSESTSDIVVVKRKKPNSTVELANDIDDLNVRYTQYVNPRNIILNKWSKDKRSRKKRRGSPVHLLDVQTIPPQRKQEEKLVLDQSRAMQNPPPPVFSPVTPIVSPITNPTQQKLQCDNKKPCKNYILPSQLKLFRQSQPQSTQNMSTTNVDEQPRSNQQVNHFQSCENCQPTGHVGNTSNYRATNYDQQTRHSNYVMPTMSQPATPPDQIRQTYMEHPVPLVNKVPKNPEIFNQRPKSVFNPRPGHEYISPYTRAYYPPVPLDRLPSLAESNVHYVDLTSDPCNEVRQTDPTRASNENLFTYMQKQSSQNSYTQRQLNQQQQQQLFQHQQALQQQQQQHSNNLFQPVDEAVQRPPSTQPMPPNPLTSPHHSLFHQYRQPPPIPASLQTGTLQTHTSAPASNTSSSNSFPYMNNIATNVQAVPLQPSTPSPVFPNLDKKYSSPRKMYNSKRSNLRHVRTDQRRIPEVYMPTGLTSQVWPQSLPHRYSAVNGIPGAQHYTYPSAQNWQQSTIDSPPSLQQTSGWPQNTSSCGTYQPFRS